MISSQDKMEMIVHKTETYNFNITLLLTDSNVIHPYYKLSPISEDDPFLQPLAADMIKISLTHIFTIYLRP